MLDYLAHSTDAWVAISFLIFLGILIKAGNGALKSVVDVKIAKIREELETADRLHTEAQELLAQYQRKHANAVQEADEIVSNAEQYANKIRKEAKKHLKESYERREKQLAERLDRMKENAIVEIQRYAAEVAVDATREIIVNKFDKKADKALVDDSVQSVSKLIH